MRVYCVKSKFLSKYLPILERITKEKAFIQFEFTDAATLITKLSNYCHCETIDENFTIFMSTDDDDICTSIKKILLNKDNIKFPAIVMLSTLLTWSGAKILSINQSNVLSLFESRIPCESAVRQYMVENTLWQLYRHGYIKFISILGLGLTYGDCCNDFQTILRNIWDKSEIVIPMDSSVNTNIVPMISTVDLSMIIEDALGKSNSDISCFDYTVCSDGTNLTISELLSQLSILVHGENLPISNLSMEQFEETVLTFDTNIYEIWRCNIVSSCQSTVRFMDNFHSLWKEFLKTSHLEPCKVVVYGTPLAGKSSLCKAIAEKLLLPYIEIVQCVKQILYNDEPTNSEIRKSLMDSIKSKLVESKKLKKADEALPLNLETLDFTNELCLSLPQNIIKKSIQLATKQHLRTGFVLDGLDGGMFSSMMDLVETGLIEMSESSELISQSCFIEIQLSDEMTIKRLHSMLRNGAEITPQTKLSKDEQQAIKALEGRLTSYKAHLTHAATNSSYHNLSKSLLNVINAIPPTVLNGTQDAQTLLTSAIDGIIGVHGEIGWLPASDCNHVTSEICKTNECMTARMDSSFEKSMNSSDNSEARELLQHNIVEMEDYLLMNILPILANGMISIHRNRPADPIKFMYDFILEEAEKTQNRVEKEMFDTFHRILVETESHKIDRYESVSSTTSSSDDN